MEAISDGSIVKATHFPIKLNPVAHLVCSCGYDGFVSLNEDQIHPNADSDVIAACPNCGSKTVHPRHVTEKATTIHHTDEGDVTLVAKDEDKPKVTPTPVPVTADDVVKQVMQHPMFTRLANFLDEQEKAKTTAGTGTGTSNDNAGGN